MTTNDNEYLRSVNISQATIQDLFAAAALAGWAAGRNVGMASFESSERSHVARSCYDYAEAMMGEWQRRQRQRREEA